MGAFEDITGRMGKNKNLHQAVTTAMQRVDEINERPTSQLRPGDGDPHITPVENPAMARAGSTQSQDKAATVAPVSDLSGITSALAQAKKDLDEASDTPEKKAARERKEKRDRVLATIGDGMSAFHEAYSHMRGVQPMTDGSSLSAKAQARKDRLERQRKEDYNMALTNYLKIERSMKDAQAAQALADYRRGQIERQKERDAAAARNQEARTNAYVKLQEAKRQNELEKSDYYTAFIDAMNNGMDETAADKWAKQEVVRLANEREAQDAAKSKAQENSYKALANQRNAAAGKSKAQAANTGATTTTTSTRYDKDGNVAGRTVTTRRKGGGKQAKDKNKSGNKQTKRKSKTQV